MNSRTQNYIQGRFGDYYRTLDVTYPPETYSREFAFIPWTDSDKTIMARHRSNHSIGGVDNFLKRNPPKHMYYSAARYENPDQKGGMSKKGWNGADLIFDLDADHFPTAQTESTKQDLLKKAKDKLQQLINLMQSDFGFNDMFIVFSGNRGYHLHIRDESIRNIESKQREEIADYVTANGLEIPSLIRPNYERGSNKREIKTEGGWGKHLFNEFLEWGRQIAEKPVKEAINELTRYDQIGEKRAENIYNTFTANHTSLEKGNMEIGGVGMRILFKQFANDKIEHLTVPIDVPVTTDTHRLIRFPGSLHGKTGLITKPVDQENLSTFSPLDDAIPERFKGKEITVDVHEDQTIYLNGKEHYISAGVQKIDEYVGIYLMSQGKAEKKSEFG